MSREHAPWRDEATLREKYLGEELTCEEIGEDLGCSGRTVSTWLNKHDIPTRDSNDYAGGPWREKEKLEELYVDEGLSTFEVADELGCSQNCIMRWLNNHDIETREVGGYNREMPWHDEEKLRELYIEKRMSIREVADHFDCWPNSILGWLERFDIPRRHTHPYFGTREDGYEFISHRCDGKYRNVRIHRLVAVAHGMLEPGEFWNSSKLVHHKDNIPWDNRPENLEVMSHSEHSTLHNNGEFEPELV